MNDKILKVLRTQAWERAKGELNSMMQTFFSGTKEESDRFCLLDAVIKDFIDNVEGNALHE
jgi:hypothetical protein